MSHPQKIFYHLKRIDATESSETALKREKTLKDYKALIEEGCLQKTALQVLNISRATLYRWRKRYKEEGLYGLENESRSPNKTRIPAWGRKKEKIVTKLRNKYKIWGKRKVWAILRRDYNINLSISTVGRIIRKLVCKGTIQPIHLFSCSYKAKKRRNFNHGHAKRWKYGMKSSGPGHLVQFDHMTVVSPVDGKKIKHFNAICPFTKVNCAMAFSAATSNIAKQFLKHARKKMPFPIKAIQVDGGSEFMGDFENHCAEISMPLFVLPPRRPQYNGNVEKVNGTVQHEFYQFYSQKSNLKTLNAAINRYIKYYNSYRPHQALNYLTPFEFLKNITTKGPSHGFASC